jgi:hypothetical protein
VYQSVYQSQSRIQAGRAMAGTNKLSDKKLKALQGPAVMRQKCMLMVKV